jgi:hypothetical protein
MKRWRGKGGGDSYSPAAPVRLLHQQQAHLLQEELQGFKMNKHTQTGGDAKQEVGAWQLIHTRAPVVARLTQHRLQRLHSLLKCCHSSTLPLPRQAQHTENGWSRKGGDIFIIVSVLSSTVVLDSCRRQLSTHDMGRRTGGTSRRRRSSFPAQDTCSFSWGIIAPCPFHRISSTPSGGTPWTTEMAHLSRATYCAYMISLPLPSSKTQYGR